MDFLSKIVDSFVFPVIVAVLLLPKRTGYETGLVRMLWWIRLAILNVWLTAASFLYSAGNFFVLLLLPFGGLILVCSVYAQLRRLGIPVSWQSIYELVKAISDDKSAWAGATLITTSTVALGHMWKLNLDKKQHLEKQRKERQEEAKSRPRFVQRGMPMEEYRRMTGPRRPKQE